MFSAEQHESFNTVGYVRLEGAVPSSNVREMYDRIWSLLSEKGFNRDDSLDLEPRSRWSAPRTEEGRNRTERQPCCARRA